MTNPTLKTYSYTNVDLCVVTVNLIFSLLTSANKVQNMEFNKSILRKKARKRNFFIFYSLFMVIKWWSVALLREKNGYKFFKCIEIFPSFINWFVIRQILKIWYLNIQNFKQKISKWNLFNYFVTLFLKKFSLCNF